MEGVAKAPAAPVSETEAGEWYAVQTKPREEQKAVEHLENQGYYVFFPMWEVKKLQRGKEVTKQEPLFPNYLFVYLRAGVDNWGPIRSTRGVQRMVAFGSRPMPVPTNIIENIAARLQQHEPDKPLSAGDRVVVATSNEAGTELEAIFSRYDGEERVIVLMTLLQQVREVKVPMSQVAKKY